MHNYIIAYLIGFFIALGIALNDVQAPASATIRQIKWKFNGAAIVWVFCMSLLSWIIVGEILYKTSKK